MSEKIGHYTIVEQLGRGGMGVVYKAHEQSLNRFVAIKVLGDHLSSDEQFLSRFVREARAAAGLSHPNIVQIYFIGEDQRRHYFAMEYVSGRSVQSMIKDEGKINNPRAAQLILQAAHGLAAAHDRGIIHRDIKPANLMVDEQGVVKIADFGIALPLEAQTRLTATGMLMGTPGYLSPEHCLGQPVDHRADIYALGVTYYEMLTGVMPFRGDSPLALLRQILQEEPPDVSTLNPEIDAESRRILAKMIAKNRDERYQTCHELIADLEEYLAARGVRRLTAGLATRAGVPISPNSAAGTPTVPEITAADVPTVVPTATPTPTQPTAVPQSPAPVTMVPAPIAAATSSRRNALLIAAAVIVLMVGGVAAALVVPKLLRSRDAVATTATQAAVLGASAENPRRDVVVPTTTFADRSAEQIELSSQKTVPLPVAEPTEATVEVKAPATQPTTARQPTRTRAEKQPSANNERVIVARTEEPARALSGVAVLVTGDPGIDGAVAEVLMSEAQAAGLDVTNVSENPDTEHLKNSGSTNAIINGVRRAGQAVVIIARVEPTGQRTLEYLGRSEPAYGSRVTLTAYDTATGRQLGRGSTTVEYTQLSASREAEKKIGPVAQKLIESLR